MKGAAFLGLAFVAVVACGGKVIDGAGPNTDGGVDGGSGPHPGTDGSIGTGPGTDGGTGTGPGIDGRAGTGPGADGGSVGADAAPPPPCPSRCSNGCADGTCEIDCSGDHACPSQNAGGSLPPIKCPAGRPCRVVCDGNDACLASVIQCAEGEPCDMECMGYDVCRGALFNCSQKNTCSLHCSGDMTCYQSTIACGKGPCTADCSDGAGALFLSEVYMHGPPPVITGTCQVW